MNAKDKYTVHSPVVEVVADAWVLISSSLSSAALVVVHSRPSYMDRLFSAALSACGQADPSAPCLYPTKSWRNIK